MTDLDTHSPRVVSLGCRLNIAESETIRAFLTGRDAVVVNSCAVTNAAVKDTRAAIRRLRRETPGVELIVTGCAATIDPAGFLGMAEVDRVVANDAKLAPASWGSALPAAPPARFAGHARALVAVQNGCDHACTFCAIPAGRGPSRSVPAGAVVSQVAGLVAAGHREVVLTGVDITSYGHDLPAPLPWARWSSGSCGSSLTCRGSGCRRSTRSRSTRYCSIFSPASRACARTFTCRFRPAMT